MIGSGQHSLIRVASGGNAAVESVAPCGRGYHFGTILLKNSKK
jgi:hypothetical protein